MFTHFAQSALLLYRCAACPRIMGSANLTFDASPLIFRVFMGVYLAGNMGGYGCICGRIRPMINTDTIQITPELLQLIAEIDEFKGAWRALGTLAPERLNALRRVATIESIGSSTRIEGSKLSDRDVERLLQTFRSRSSALVTSRKWRATPRSWRWCSRHGRTLP